MAIFARARDFSSFRQLKHFCYSIILPLFDLKKIAAHFNDKKSGFWLNLHSQIWKKPLKIAKFCARANLYAHKAPEKLCFSF